MRGPSPRFLFNASLVGLLIAVQGGAVVAQIPNPVGADLTASDPVSVTIAGEENQATVGTPEEPAHQDPVPTEAVVEPAPQLDEMVTTVEETAAAIADNVETLVGQIQETVETVEQTGAPIEETVATTEVTAAGTNDPAEGGQVTDPVQTQDNTEQSEAAAVATEQTASDSADPVDVVTETAGPIDAIEVLGGALQETVTTVQEAEAELTGPIDAIEVLGGALQETVTTVQETGQDIIAAIEALEGDVQNAVITVDATAQQIVDSVEVLQVQIEETVNSAEQTAEQTVAEVDELATLGGEIQETVTKVEETAQEIVGVLEILETNIEETVNELQTITENVVDAVAGAPGATQESVESVKETAQQVVDVVEVLQAQIEKAVTTVEETARVVEVIEVLETQVANAEAPAEATTQQMVDAVEGLVTEIESSLNPVRETAPQIVVAVEGLVERIEDSIQLVSDTGTQIEVSAVTLEEEAGVPVGPSDAVEVLGGGELALQSAALGEGPVRGEGANAVDAGGSLDSATKNDGSGLSITNAPENSASTDAGGRSIFRGSFVAAAPRGSTLSVNRSALNWTAILGVSQPSLAILVDAVNDANGDGIYTDAEIASTPGADVSFKALITNIGAVNFEIATVTNSYNGGTGAAQGTVCGELVGIMLAPGESLACSFPVPDYSPAKGGTLVNSITAAGFEVGKKARRGASDNDTSTVDTLLAGDEVLAVAIKRNLAFTGTDAARLLALALLLLAMGGIFLSLARFRNRRPVRPLPSESPIDVLGWWAAGPIRTDSKWKLGRR
jgi:methyl-accepting chemotaxis protein